jgi:hypothetical protein
LHQYGAQLRRIGYPHVHDGASAPGAGIDGVQTIPVTRCFKASIDEVTEAGADISVAAGSGLVLA